MNLEKSLNSTKFDFMVRDSKTTLSSFSKDRVKIPMSFHVAEMKADLERIEQANTSWTDHFVTQNYSGSWSVIPLRATKGAEHPIMMIYSDPTVQEFVDTPFLELCEYLPEVLTSFKTELTAVRLMKLEQGSVIKEHRDHDLDLHNGTVRIHVPIVTNDQVEFYLNGTRVIMNEGECWYLRLADPHKVVNNGADRIHLVLDLKVNDWLRELITGNKIALGE